MSSRTLRVGLVASSVAIALAAIAVRLAELALVDGERLAGLAGRQHFAREEMQPIRGAILDRDGQPLALSVEAGSIYVRPNQLPRDGRPHALAADLGLAPGEFVRKVSGPAKFVWIKRQAVPRELEMLREADVPGFGVLTERRRLYPQGRLAAPVLGFAGVDSQGLEGIELAYDSHLRGAAHEVGVARDAYGRKIFIGDVDGGPRQGADVVLTLDVALQYAAEQALDAQVAATRAKGGLAIVLEPRTGEVLALAQSPSYDPNRPALSPASARKNHAITDAFEPGSTMKGLLAAAVLENGVARLDERLDCENGAYRIGRRTIHDHHPYAWLTLPEVFHFSSNICSAKLGERLGVERYASMLEAFGVGARTGIDLAGEQPGIVRPRHAWKPIDLATASFGHGIALTPLQLAVAYGTLANGGVRMRPFVVKRVVAEDGSVLVANQPTAVRRVVSAETAARVTEILEGVVDAKGTGKAAAVPGLRIAGKTGTAQKVDFVNGGYGRGRIASFVGYFPAEKPAFVVSVVVDEPKTSVYGGTVAAPVFRQIALAAAERYGLRSEPDGAEPELLQKASAVVADFGTVEPEEESRTSFLGLSLAEALRQARAQGLVVEVRGAGYVVDQTPAPGFAPAPGTVVELRLDSGEGPPA